MAVIEAMFGALIVAARDRKRLAEIGGVATRFGLDALLARLGLGGAEGREAAEPLSRRTRLALETLGPTFVKLGQILSTRSDLLPPDWIAELEQLQSAAPTLDFEILRPSVEAALGGRPEEVFAEFDVMPLAAASIAQVHRATLQSGAPVVVKIRRPGIRPQMEADLRLIGELVRTAERSSAEVRRYRPQELVRQLTEAVLAELDFTAEGRNADRFAANFARRPAVIIPAIYWDFTSETVLVQDYLDGVAPTEAQRLIDAGLSPRDLAEVGAKAVLDMILVHGLFHADPHPGNLRAMPGGRLGLLDFGMVGHVSPRRRTELVGFVQSLVSGDAQRMGEVLATWTEGAEVSNARIIQGAERLIARHGQGEIDLPAIVADMMALMRQERVAAPPDLVLILKALVTIEGVLSRVDPDFDLVSAMSGAWKSALFAGHSPEAVRDRLIGLLLDLSAVSDDLPRLIRAASKRLTSPEADPPRDLATSAAIRGVGGWIALAILGSGAMIAAALVFT